MNYAFEGFAHEFGRRGGPRMGPFAGSGGGRAHMRGAPFQMWVAQTDDDVPVDEGGHRERGRGKRGHGDRGRRGAGGGFGRGRESMRPGFGAGGFGAGGFGPNADFGRGRGRGGRGRRGDVRAAILLLLEERPMHGYELIQQIADKSNGTWKPSPGSIYPALSQLEDEGLVLIDKVAGRKTAALTDEGRSHIEQHREDLGSPWDDVADSVGFDARDLRALIGQLMGAAGQVAGVGTPRQVELAADILVEARKSMYRILAEDGPHDAEPDETVDAPDAT
ncbi:PadR family transcriptional regulator [Rhodococcus ruber]|uniref:PadR family transcriptional regulator n=2 Tax=Rhodococcus ruber TaxID=1830 RepID=A0ABT4MBE2_9NOCA|nr:PadR family transcriptional regulator [Rhodococcus ruber]MCZ4518294.1 PadR family transcriptional regulator [Rhodococcus ruber]